MALSRRGQSTTRHHTSHRGVSVERGFSAFRFRIVPHLGKAELNFKDRVPTRSAAQPRSALPVGSRDSHRRGREAACAVQGLGCRARSPPSPGPGPVPMAPLTQQQQLDLARRLLAILPEVAVDHLAALHGRLVLGAQCAAHGGRASPRPRRRGRLAARAEAGRVRGGPATSAAPASWRQGLRARTPPPRAAVPAGDTPRSAPSAAATAAAAGGRAAAAASPRELGVRAAAAPPLPAPRPLPARAPARPPAHVPSDSAPSDGRAPA